MNSVAPLGPVYQAGTLSGNPVAVTCGLATLHEIQQPGFYKRLLSEQTAKLVKGLGAMAKKHGVAFSAQSIGGMFGIYFRKCPTFQGSHGMRRRSLQDFLPCHAG